MAMSEISLTLVVQNQSNKILNDMAKVVIKSEKLTPFGGIFSIMELFNCILGGTIDCVLGQSTRFIHLWSAMGRLVWGCGFKGNYKTWN